MKAIVAQAARLEGAVDLPGDKSISHRALILGALAPDPLVIENLAPGQDVEATARCLEALGATIERDEGRLRIRGPGRLGPPAGALDCGNSGTTMRLLAGVIAGAGIEAVLDGDESLRRRPMGRMLGPLRALGARCEGRRSAAGSDEEFAPLVFRGGKLAGGAIRIPVASAQVKSALLLAGLVAGVEVEVEEPLPSRDHTERMLAAFAAGGRLRLPSRLPIPGDPSSAAFLAAAAAALPGSVLLLRGMNANPTRIGWVHAFRRMGVPIDLREEAEVAGEPVATLELRGGGELRGIRIGAEEVPALIDELPILAALATRAEGETSIRGAAELRVKESDRIAAMAEGLSRLGARIEALDDGLRILGPTPLRGAPVEAESDHRVAMSLAVAGLWAEGTTTIAGGQWADVSFPGFYDLLDALRAS